MSARVLECQDFSEGGNSGPTIINDTKDKRRRDEKEETAPISRLI